MGLTKSHWHGDAEPAERVHRLASGPRSLVGGPRLYRQYRQWAGELSEPRAGDGSGGGRSAGSWRKHWEGCGRGARRWVARLHQGPALRQGQEVGGSVDRSTHKGVPGNLTYFKSEAEPASSAVLTPGWMTQGPASPQPPLCVSSVSSGQQLLWLSCGCPVPSGLGVMVCAWSLSDQLFASPGS